MPSERAMRAARAINITITEDGLGRRCDLITSDDIAAIISSEYAELEAYVEYVKKTVLCDRTQSSETMPSFFSLGELMTFKEWKKEHK